MYAIDATLAEQTINYIFMQLDNTTLRGRINVYEYAFLLKRAIVCELELLFLKNFTRDLISRQIFMRSTENLVALLFTRVLNGLDYKLLLEEIKASATRTTIVKS